MNNSCHKQSYTLMFSTQFFSKIISQEGVNTFNLIWTIIRNIKNLFIFFFTIPFGSKSQFLWLDEFKKIIRTYHISMNDGIIFNRVWTWLKIHYIFSICSIVTCWYRTNIYCLNKRNVTHISQKKLLHTPNLFIIDISIEKCNDVTFIEPPNCF